MSWDTDPGFVEVSFKNGARKDIFRKPANLILDKHDAVVVEVLTGGFDVGFVSLTGEMAKLQMKRKRVNDSDPGILAVQRKANDYDLQKMQEVRALEHETMTRGRAIARSLELQMKIGDVEYQGDGRKATFYYTADDRVDFRELIKILAKEFRVKIEMHQIGARQEAGRLGGIGSCGRELCCSTWLTDFKSVTTSAARYQNLAINQVKLSGQCGRLKCCLNYELDTYIDALKDVPTHVEKLETDKGILFLQKTDIFKKLMWYAYKDHSGYRALTAERVLEIEKLNKEGVKIADTAAASAAQPERVKKSGMQEEEAASVELVGQTSLRSLEKHSKKKRDSQRGKKEGQRDARSNNPRDAQQPRDPRGAQTPREQRGPQQPARDQQRNKPQQPRGPREPRPAQLDANGAPVQQPNQPQRPPRNNDNRRNQPRPNQPNQPGEPHQPNQDGQQQHPPQQRQGNRDNNQNRNRGPRPDNRRNPQQPVAPPPPAEDKKP